MDDAKEKQYAVTIPVAGSITVFVTASSEEEAVDLAFENQDWSVESGENTEAGEFEAMRHIVRGNVCYAPFREICVEEDS